MVKDDGTFVGVPCTTWGEARELQAQHEGSKIFEMKYDNSNFEEWAVDGFDEFEVDKFSYDEMAANP